MDKKQPNHPPFWKCRETWYYIAGYSALAALGLFVRYAAQG